MSLRGIPARRGLALRRPPKRRSFRVARVFDAPWFWGLVGFGVILGVWVFINETGLAEEFVLPAPWAVAERMVEIRGALLQAMWDTAFVCLVGFACGLAVGIALALAMHFSPRFNRAIKPTLVASQTVPLLALAPVLVLWFGFTIVPKLIIVSLLVFFPITMNMADGLRSTSPELRSFARSLGASRLDILRYCEIPSALPQLFTGVRIAATYTVIAAIIAEWVNGQSGLGALMLRANFSFETEVVFATVILMVVLGVAFYVGAVGLERLVIPWHAKRHQTRASSRRH